MDPIKHPSHFCHSFGLVSSRLNHLVRGLLSVLTLPKLINMSGSTITPINRLGVGHTFRNYQEDYISIQSEAINCGGRRYSTVHSTV